MTALQKLVWARKTFCELTGIIFLLFELHFDKKCTMSNLKKEVKHSRFNYTEHR